MQCPTGDLQSLVTSVEQLEKQNRFLRRVTPILPLVPVGLVLMGQAKPGHTVEAEKFVLRDSQGRQRLVISTPSGSGAAFDLRPDEAAIWIVGENGVDRAILSSDGLRFADEKGKALAEFAPTKLPSGTYYTLRSYGIWTVGESRGCLFAKNIDNAPCFTTEQARNGTQEHQHEYLVMVTFDRPIPFGDSGNYGVVCRLQSNSQAWCHVE